jgi:hypothetical protein
MENTASYWKELYFKVYSENRELRIELENLQQAYKALESKYKSNKPLKSALIDSKPPLANKKLEIKIAHSADISHIQTITDAIIAPGYEIFKQTADLKNSFSFNPSGTSKRPPEEEKAAEIDINPDLSLFEELFILSVSSNFKSASVIGRYPNLNDM